MMLSKRILVDLLTAMVAASAPLENVTVHLVKDTFIPTPNTLPAELATHEADYTGYAASTAVDWLTPYIDGDGSGVVRAESVEFQPTGTATANTIYSYWLQTGTGGTAKLVGFKLLDEPVTLATPFDAYICDPEFVLRNDNP